HAVESRSASRRLSPPPRAAARRGDREARSPPPRSIVHTSIQGGQRMSRDEIIQGWKAGKDVGGKDAPPDPAGEVHLSEEELEAVAGGAADDGPTLDCTANQSWC